MSQGSDVILQIDRRQIAEYILSLLGQQRKIERSFEGGRFIIDHNWTIGLTHIFEQRMTQNIHSVVSFKARFFYNDGSIYTVNTLEAFKAYTDFSNKISVGVDISVVYLVEFGVCSAPEKQQIRFEIFSDFAAKESFPSKTKGKRTSKVQYSIEFTNLTWGEDISRHINAYVKSIYINNLQFKIIRWLADSRIASLFLLLFSMITTLWFVAPSVDIQQKRSFEALVNNNTADALSKKLNIVIESLFSQQHHEI